jgi:hypothetical protein
MSEADEIEKRKRRRTKYLLRSVLRVDVDLITSVHMAEKVDVNTKEWGEYMNRQGGLLILPSCIVNLGKRSDIEELESAA